MINKMSIGVALILIVAVTVVLTASPALSQNNSSRIGDDYARAALRAIIYTNQSAITAQRISILVDEADVEASTPAERGLAQGSQPHPGHLDQQTQLRSSGLLPGTQSQP
jgi:hypothetical protein